MWLTLANLLNLEVKVETMTPVGITKPQCTQALLHFYESINDISRLIESRQTRQPEGAAKATELFEELKAELKRDLDARLRGDAQKQMTRVERETFFRAIVETLRKLTWKKTAVPDISWLDVLYEVSFILRVHYNELEAWEEQEAVI